MADRGSLLNVLTEEELPIGTIFPSDVITQPSGRSEEPELVVVEPPMPAGTLASAVDVVPAATAVVVRTPAPSALPLTSPPSAVMEVQSPEVSPYEYDGPVL